MDWTTLSDKARDLYVHGSSLVYVLIIVIATLVVSQVLQWVLNAIVKREKPEVTPWRNAFLEALGPPLRAIVWVIGLTVATDLFMHGGQGGGATMLSELFPPARNIVVILAVAWFFLRLVGRAQTNLESRASLQGERLDPTASDAIGKILRASIVVTAVLAGMQSLGFSISSLLAFGGAAGIAVGFAAQSLVANLLGGLTVFATRIFKIGEDIIIPDADLMGEVEHIGWRATRVMGWDYKPFYVPNSKFNTSTVINHSRKTRRRIMEYVHLRYSDIDKVPAIVADANQMIVEHPGIDHNFFVFRFDSYGDFALKLFLYAYTLTTDYPEFMAVKEDVLLEIARIIDAHGAELAVPVSTVHMPEGLRVETAPRPSGSEPAAVG